jgi:hypothetical protein
MAQPQLPTTEIFWMCQPEPGMSINPDAAIFDVKLVARL